MTKLIAESVLFYSQNDESAFFDWLRKIESIENIEGVGSRLYLHTKDAYLPDDDLRDLISIFFRYGIEMGQLSAFLSNENSEWFNNIDMYWHESVFGR